MFPKRRKALCEKCAAPLALCWFFEDENDDEDEVTAFLTKASCAVSSFSPEDWWTLAGDNIPGRRGEE